MHCMPQRMHNAEQGGRAMMTDGRFGSRARTSNAGFARMSCPHLMMNNFSSPL